AKPEKPQPRPAPPLGGAGGGTPPNPRLPRPRGDAVLVVEDNATAREALRKFLTQKGFRTFAAASGEEGLRLARQLRPLAITLDLTMPGMDGWAVLTGLKADPELADIPVILFTGMADDRGEAFRRGASDFVTKPVDPDRLAAVLKRYSGDPAARRGPGLP